MHHKKKEILPYLIVLILWYLLSLFVKDELIVPKPSLVLKSLYRLIIGGQLLHASLISLSRILFGLFLSWIFGIFVSTLAYLFKITNYLKPVISIIRSTPVVSFILFLMFFASKATTVYIVVFAISFPILYESIINSLLHQNNKRLELAMVYGLNNKQKLKYIYLPIIIKSSFDALIVSIGLAFKAGASAEVIAGARGGLGDLLYFSKLTFSADELFAVTLVIIALSYFVESGFRLIHSKVIQND